LSTKSVTGFSVVVSAALALFAYQQILISREQMLLMKNAVDPTNNIEVKVEQIALSRPDGLQLTISFANFGNYPIYLDDAKSTLLRRQKAFAEDVACSPKTDP